MTPSCTTALVNTQRLVSAASPVQLTVDSASPETPLHEPRARASRTIGTTTAARAQ